MAEFGHDTFGGGAGNLNARTPDTVGAQPWATDLGALQTTAAGRVFHPGISNDNGIARLTVTPPGANYYTRSLLHKLSSIGQTFVGATVRHQAPTTYNWYMGAYNDVDGEAQLSVVYDNGASTLELGAAARTFNATESHWCGVAINGDQIELWWDDVLAVGPVTDTRHSAASFAGLVIAWASGTSDTNGIQIDEWIADDTLPSAGGGTDFPTTARLSAGGWAAAPASVHGARGAARLAAGGWPEASGVVRGTAGAARLSGSGHSSSVGAVGIPLASRLPGGGAFTAAGSVGIPTATRLSGGGRGLGNVTVGILTVTRMFERPDVVSGARLDHLAAVRIAGGGAGTSAAQANAPVTAVVRLHGGGTLRASAILNQDVAARIRGGGVSSAAGGLNQLVAGRLVAGGAAALGARVGNPTSVRLAGGGAGVGAAALGIPVAVSARLVGGGRARAEVTVGARAAARLSAGGLGVIGTHHRMVATSRLSAGAFSSPALSRADFFVITELAGGGYLVSSNVLGLVVAKNAVELEARLARRIELIADI